MSILERLTRFIERVFKTTVEVFLEALKRSPNAQGYVSGSITEFLLTKKLEEEYSCEVKRIREKWEGRKSTGHRGDFYFRKSSADPWYVIESKGLKSNSEKWHKLYNYQNFKSFLFTHASKIPWLKQEEEIESQIEYWINTNLPKFQNEYSQCLYDYEEVQKYLKNIPKRTTVKSKAITALRRFTREQINKMIEERLQYLMSRIMVLESHFVSGLSSSSERTQATPRKDEFNVISIDISLRYPAHKFLFANPKHLESSGDDANHLQQNYIIGFIFVDEQGNSPLSVTEEWCEDFNQIYETLNTEDSVKEEDMQIDTRYKIVAEND